MIQHITAHKISSTAMHYTGAHMISSTTIHYTRAHKISSTTIHYTGAHMISSTTMHYTGAHMMQYNTLIQYISLGLTWSHQPHNRITWSHQPQWSLHINNTVRDLHCHWVTYWCEGLNVNYHIWTDELLECSLTLKAFFSILQYGCSLGHHGDTTKMTVDILTAL